MVIRIKHHTVRADAHASGIRNQVIQDEKLSGCAGSQNSEAIVLVSNKQSSMGKLVMVLVRQQVAAGIQFKVASQCCRNSKRAIHPCFHVSAAK